VYGVGSVLPVTGESVTGTISWYVADEQDSSRMILDNSGAVASTATYDAYGNLISGSYAGRFAYGGGQWDSQTGLQLQGNGTREYDPSTGRWYQQDPLGFGAGDANLYRYVGNTPTTQTDPSGMVESQAVTAQDPGGGGGNLGGGSSSEGDSGGIASESEDTGGTTTVDGLAGEDTSEEEMVPPEEGDANFVGPPAPSRGKVGATYENGVVNSANNGSGASGDKALLGEIIDRLKSGEGVRVLDVGGQVYVFITLSDKSVIRIQTTVISNPAFMGPVINARRSLGLDRATGGDRDPIRGGLYPGYSDARAKLQEFEQKLIKGGVSPTITVASAIQQRYPRGVNPQITAQIFQLNQPPQRSVPLRVLEALPAVPKWEEAIRVYDANPEKSMVLLREGMDEAAIEVAMIYGPGLVFRGGKYVWTTVRGARAIGEAATVTERALVLEAEALVAERAAGKGLAPRRIPSAAALSSGEIDAVVAESLTNRELTNIAIRGLEGVTTESTAVADALMSGRITIVSQPAAIFNGNAVRAGAVGNLEQAARISAFHEGNVIWVRENARGINLFGDILHEGIHSLDALNPRLHLSAASDLGRDIVGVNYAREYSAWKAEFDFYTNLNRPFTRGTEQIWGRTPEGAVRVIQNEDQLLQLIRAGYGPVRGVK
jgi:RHS repeat-associated protein